LTRAPLAQFFGELGAALLLAIPLFRVGKIKLTGLEWREGWRILRGSWSLAITRLLRMFMTSFDLVLLGLMLGERETGLYAAPYRICFLFLAVAAAIQSSYLPAITRALAHSAEQAKAIAARSVGFSAAVAAPALVGGIVLSAPLLQAVFGPDYVTGAWAFRLLLLGMGFICFFGTAHNILLACDRLKDEMWLMAVAAGLNVGLNLIVIPRYGLAGAAAVTALTEGLVLMIALLTVARLGVGISLWPLCRPFLAAGVMGAVIMSLGANSELGMRIGLGAVVYVITLGLVHGVPEDARPHLRQVAALASELRKKFQRA
jgi:O-antigen/teichoic acid export membrane protein